MFSLEYNRIIGSRSFDKDIYYSVAKTYEIGDCDDSFVSLGKPSIFDKKNRVIYLSREGQGVCLILSPNAEIYVDGNLTRFTALKNMLSEKNIAISTVSGFNAVLIQTAPKAYEAKVLSISEGIVVVSINGNSIPYYIDNISFSIGDSIRFIPDGNRIIEVKKI